MHLYKFKMLADFYCSYLHHTMQPSYSSLLALNALMKRLAGGFLCIQASPRNTEWTLDINENQTLTNKLTLILLINLLHNLRLLTPSLNLPLL
mmetsp:Transcript_29127/g.45822  ORF Transcript_29127/g.45822 Transcript_29127/m.45822 type:complete len:93 (-) Transcript_29127:427-705(-)